MRASFGRGPRARVTSQNHFPLSVDEKSIKHIPGAQVVQVGNFLAVVAPKEYDAIQAAAQLKVIWKSDPKLAGSGNFWAWLRQAGDTNTTNPARFTTNVGNVDSALKSSAKTVSATYKYQYNGHMSIGPTCAIADVQKDHMTVFCNSQQPSSVPTTLAAFQVNGQPYFGLPAKEIRAVYYEGASSFGGMLGTGGQTDVYIGAAVHLEGGRQAGAPAVDALGRARLDGIRPGRDVRREGRRRRERQHHGARLDVVRAGRHVADADVGARRLRHLAGDPRQRRPEHVGRHLQGVGDATSGCSRRRSRCTAARSRATRCVRRARRSRTSRASS